MSIKVTSPHILLLLGLASILTLVYGGRESYQNFQRDIRIPKAQATDTLLNTGLPSTNLPPANREQYIETFQTITKLGPSSDIIWDTSQRQVKLSSQDNLVQQHPVVVANAEVIYAVWQDLRSDDGDIYAQRIGDDGTLIWDEGIRVNSDRDRATQSAPAAAVDSAGYLWVTWVDNRNGSQRILVQRISPEGTTIDSVGKWFVDAAAGRIQGESSVQNFEQGGPAVCIRPDGNAIVVWHDNRNGDYDVYAQILDTTGTPQWDEDIQLNSDNSLLSQTDPTAAIDPFGNTTIAWLDRRIGNGDIYAQSLSSDGGYRWPGEIKLNATFSSSTRGPSITQFDQDHIIAWIGTDASVYMQRIDGSGKIQWNEGLSINGSQLAAVDTSPAIQADAKDGSFVVWKSRYSGNLLAQQVDHKGQPQWDIPKSWIGEHVDLPTTFRKPSFVQMGGSFLTTWAEQKFRKSADIFVQSVSALGESRWSNDSLVNQRLGSLDQSHPTVVSYNDSAVVVWQEHRSKSPTLLAQRYSATGQPLWRNNIRLHDYELAEQDLLVADAASDGETIGVVWADSHSGSSNVYLQLLDSNGNRLLTQPLQLGIQASDDDSQYSPKVDMSRDGNIYVAWEEVRDGEYYVMAQELDSTLNTVSASVITKGRQPDIAVNSEGQIQILWLSIAGSDIDVMSKRITDFSNLNLQPELTVNHLEGRVDLYSAPKVAVDANGDSAVVWVDRTTSGVYLQRLASGTTLSSAEGLLISSLPSTLSATPTLALDNGGNALITWQGFYAGQLTIFAQKISKQQERLWKTDSFDNVVVSLNVIQGEYPAVDVDPAGSATIVWHDRRSMNPNVYLQRLDLGGNPTLPQEVQIPATDSFVQPQGSVTSTKVNSSDAGIGSAIVTADFEENGGAIQFELSNNGGMNWFSVRPGIRHSFPTVGSDLRWRATLLAEPLNLRQSPILSQLRIDYSERTDHMADDYELNDQCENAQPIQIDGLAQVHVSETAIEGRVSPIDWISFDAHRGKSYAIRLNYLRANDVELKPRIWADCTATPLIARQQQDTLGQYVTFTSDITQTVYLSVSQNPVSGKEISPIAYQLSVREDKRPGLAILVAGRIAADDPKQANVDYAADSAYRVLRQSGYQPEQIIYFGEGTPRDIDGDGQFDNIRTLSSVEPIQEAISEWAVSKLQEQNLSLLIYLAGQTVDDELILGRDENGTNWSLNASKLDLWLSNLEGRSDVEQTILIVEGNQAAGFVTNLRAMRVNEAAIIPVDRSVRSGHTFISSEIFAGAKRILIASTHAEGLAWPSPKGMLFSDAFWLALSEGMSVYEAYGVAKDLISDVGYSCSVDSQPCQIPFYGDTSDTMSPDVLTGIRGQRWGFTLGAAFTTPNIYSVSTIVENEGTQDELIGVQALLENATSELEVVAYLVPLDYFEEQAHFDYLPQHDHPIIVLNRVDDLASPNLRTKYRGSLPADIVLEQVRVVVYAWEPTQPTPLPYQVSISNHGSQKIFMPFLVTAQ